MGLSLLVAISVDQLMEIGICLFAIWIGLRSMSFMEFAFTVKLCLVVFGALGLYELCKSASVCEGLCDCQDQDDEVDSFVADLNAAVAAVKADEAAAAAEEEEFADLVEPQTKEIIPPTNVEEK